MTTDQPRPTNVRYLIVGVTALAAMWMYIDRVCFSTLSKPVGRDLGIDPDQMSFVLGAFFLTYALFQIPIGALADRYGPRLILTVCIAAWSICTAATSFAGGALGLLAVRLALGACEAGAYPASAGLVRKWSAATERGMLSSMVAFGGRIGGALAPFLTAWAAVTWLGDPATDRTEWRGVFVAYGAAGLVVAALFWFVVRDSPASHPWANAAEANRVAPYVAPPLETSPGLKGWLSRLAPVFKSFNLWLFGATQFCVNIGWIFLITSLPDYLDDRFQVDLKDIGLMQSAPLIASCLGMAIGGVFGDFMYRWLGPRWGRSLPIGIVLFLCAITYFAATRLSSPWAVIYALSAMAFLVDLSVPSIWAFAQDVGGRQVGVALGWGNMWGNFGAAISPVALQFIRKEFGWDVAFLLCSACFVLAGISALNLNATIPLVRPKRSAGSATS